MATKLNYTYLYFDVVDQTGNHTLSTFTLDIASLTFKPDFSTSPILSGSTIISNNTLRWDFGDGSYSTDLIPTHTYEWPGRYNVTLTIFDNYGNAYDSTFITTVEVFDFISTQIAFTDHKSLVYDIPAGQLIDPLTLNAYFSWQSHQALSATGYTINLYASGARGDYNYVAATRQDKWEHLRSLSRFYTLTAINGVDEYIDIDSMQLSTKEVYVNIQNNQLQICSSTDTGSVLAGVTGSCQFWYTDDRPANLLTKNNPIIVFATLDNTKFHDQYTQRTNAFDYINYPPYGFQNIDPAVFPAIKTRYNPVDHLSITTTGIDGEGVLSATNFNIPYISWQETDIPYVITLKDNLNFTTKNYPPLSSSCVENATVGRQTYYDLQTGIAYDNGNGQYLPLSGVTFYEDFVPEAPQSMGAFYKGYFRASVPSYNCVLTASMNVLDPAYYHKDSIVSWIAIPQYNSALRLIRQENIDGYTGATTISFLDTPSSELNVGNNRNIYSIAVAPSGSTADSDYETWFADSVNDQIVKYDVYGNALPVYYTTSQSGSSTPVYKFALSAMPTLVNNIVSYVDYRSTASNDVSSYAAPSNMSIDLSNNLWVTLADSGSAIKIDTLNGYVTTVAAPDSIYTAPTGIDTTYGESSLILPTSIDTDINNNVWITYNNPNFSCLVKYQGTNNNNTAANILTAINFPDNISPEEVHVDRNSNVWITATNHNSKGVSLNDRNDYLYKYDNNGNLLISLSGFKQIGNIAIDGDQNAWVIQGIETLTKVDGVTYQRSDYTAGIGKNTTDYICSIGGITCDTSNNIWVINNFDKAIYVFNPITIDPANFNPAYTLPLTFPTTSLPPVTAYDLSLLPGSNLSYPSILTNRATVNDPGFVYGYTTALTAGTAPDWTNTATRLVGSGYANFNQYNILTNATYTPYTASVYVSTSATNNSILRLSLQGSNAVAAYADFNTTTKFVSASTQGSGVSALSATASYTGIRDWYRVSITGTFSAASTYFGIVVNNPTAPIDVFVWGGQVEKSATMNNFVPTTTASVLSSYTTPRIYNVPVDQYSDGLQEFQAIGDWNGYNWLNKYAAPVSTIRTITGASSLFNIYPGTGEFGIMKINENWDASGYYKSLRFQETMLDKQVFFEQFLGVILGDAEAQPYELGKTVYEKIANFVDNNSDVDKVNINQLISFCRELTVDFERHNYTLPSQIQRLVDLLSIKQSVLWGRPNTYALNFDSRGTTIANNTYGINLSSIIDITTGLITNGTPIVAYELFSGTYKVVNTNYIGTDTSMYGVPIPLSAYSPDWGWGLVAPDNVTGTAISSYYNFYNYNPVQDNTYYNNIIDWNNPLTTLTPFNSSYNTWSSDNGIIQNAISYELSKGYRLFTSAVNIAYNS